MYSARFTVNHIADSRLEIDSFSYLSKSVLLTDTGAKPFCTLTLRPTMHPVCACEVFVHVRPDVPLQTSYLGRCSSLRLLWSCSKPWRSPESSPGLDRSSIHLEKNGRREQLEGDTHEWWSKLDFFKVMVMSPIIDPCLCQYHPSVLFQFIFRCAEKRYTAGKRTYSEWMVFSNKFSCYK